MEKIKNKLSRLFEINPKKHSFLIKKLDTGAKCVEQKIQVGFIISEIPPEGILLNKSGTYSFDRNIDWYPIKDTIGICISSKNVTLDLKSFSFRCINPNNFETIGIKAFSSNNLEIKNGKIIGMGLSGVNAELCNHVLFKSLIVKNINTNNIVKYTTPTGFKTSFSENIKISKCVVCDISVRVGSFSGFEIAESINSKLSKCVVNKVKNLDGAAVGYSQFLSIISSMKCCKAMNMQTFFNGNTNTQGHTCIGFSPFFSVKLQIINCSVKNIIGTCDDAHGFSMFVCEGPIFIKDCSVDNVQDGVGKNTGAKSTGIEIYSSDVLVTDCTVANIKAINPQDKQCTGFSVSGNLIGGEATNVKFYNCKAKNVNVCDENGNYNSCLGYGIGFGSPPDPRFEFQVPCSNITWEKCYAENCQVGFDSWWQKNSLWTNLCTFKCGISILNMNNSQRTVSCNTCSECNPPKVITLDNVAKNNVFNNIKATYNKNNLLSIDLSS